MEPIYWYIIAYVVGTVVGYYMGRGTGIAVGITRTVDDLIIQGYIKVKQCVDGELILIKLPKKQRYKR